MFSSIFNIGYAISSFFPQPVFFNPFSIFMLSFLAASWSLFNSTQFTPFIFGSSNLFFETLQLMKQMWDPFHFNFYQIYFHFYLLIKVLQFTVMHIFCRYNFFHFFELHFQVLPFFPFYFCFTPSMLVFTLYWFILEPFIFFFNKSFFCFVILNYLNHQVITVIFKINFRTFYKFLFWSVS